MTDRNCGNKKEIMTEIGGRKREEVMTDRESREIMTDSDIMTDINERGYTKEKR